MARLTSGRYHCPMRCSVLQTHENGERLPKEKVRSRAPAVGNLLIRLHDGNAVRTGNFARLAYVGPSVQADPLLPLFDVTLVKMVDEGFLLSGYEIQVKDGVMRELAQGWWCKPA